MAEEIKQEIKKADDGFKPIPTGPTEQPVAPRQPGGRQGFGRKSKHHRNSYSWKLYV